MKIESVRIQNFRSFADETVIFDDYTCLVGPNGTGKSTVLTALNIFFREVSDASTDLTKLSREDFHNENIAAPVEITVTFDELSDEAKHDLKDYVRQDKLIVSAIAKWSDAAKSAEVKQFGNRLGIQEFRAYFDKEKAGAKVPELQTIFAELRAMYPYLGDVKTKAAMEEALNTYEAAHPDHCTLIPSEDQFYGFSRGTNILQKYIQWVCVPAVKDATTEQVESKNTALGKLLARRVRSQLVIDDPINALKLETIQRYQGILRENVAALDGLSGSLNAKFQRWAHQNARLKLNWQSGENQVAISQPTAEVKTGEGVFEGELARFGHGLQRSFIFALLEEQAEHTDTGPRLILACEEPELYQHPPQARYLASLLQRLSAQNAQIVVCTHSPYFATGRSFEHIRVFSKDSGSGRTKVAQATFDAVAQRIADAKGERPTRAGGVAAVVEQDLQGPMNEMFFARVRVFVEGLEDIGYISSYLSLLNLWDDFRSLGCHLVQVQGKSNLVYAVALTKQLGLPSFTIFDADGNTPADTPDRLTGKRAKHEKDNLAILSLNGEDTPVAFPAETYWGRNIVQWKNCIGDIVEEEIGANDLQRLKEQVSGKYGIFVHDKDKNTLFIGYLMAEAWEAGKKSPTLERLCRAILEHCTGLDAAPAMAAAAAAVDIPAAVEILT